MRTTRMAFAIQGEKTPLIVRASLPRTFWTLGIFVECSLLFAGCYLLVQATLRPLEADPSSVLAAGVILALAATLFVYLVRPWRRAALSRMEDSMQPAATGESPLTAFGDATRLRQEAERVLLEMERLPGPM
jgi:type VI protein secretion system component VasK